MNRGLTLVMCLVVALLLLASVGGQPAHAASCADYPNQAAAQHAADTRDGDGDGVYCESLPCPCAKPAGDSGGGGGPTPAPPVGTNPTGCVRPSAVQNISFSKTKYPNIRRHFLDALRKGWPRTLGLNRQGADARRDRLLAPFPTRPGEDATSIRQLSGAAKERGSSAVSTPPAGVRTCATCHRARTARTARRSGPSCGACATGRGFGTCSTRGKTRLSSMRPPAA